MLKRRSPISIFAGFTLSVVGALIFNIGGLFAGRSAILLGDLQQFLAWVFLIYPLLLTVRGDINGILSGKLGTALHLGSIKPSWKKNTSRFHQLVGFIFLLSFYDAILVGFVSTLLGFLLNITINLLEVMIISVTTFVMGSIISLILTSSLTFFIFKRKGDPDVYVYPIMSSINDILITLLFIGVCYFYRTWLTNVNLHLYFGLPLLLIITSLVIFYILKYRKETYVKNSIMQSLPTITITNLIAAGTGAVLVSFQSILNQTPILIVFYPALLSTVGGQGSIIANTSTTRLHLGTIKPSFSFFKSSHFFNTFFGIIIAGFLLNLIYSILSTAIFPKGMTFALYWKFLAILIITNLLSFAVIGFIAIGAAFLTYRFGLDPDNLVNPLLSSSADLITTSIIVLSYILIF